MVEGGDVHDAGDSWQSRDSPQVPLSPQSPSTSRAKGSIPLRPASGAALCSQRQLRLLTHFPEKQFEASDVMSKFAKAL